MKWKLLAYHSRQCPKCEMKLTYAYKNNFSQKIGMKCPSENCDFFITTAKLKELAPNRKQLMAKRKSVKALQDNK